MNIKNDVWKSTVDSRGADASIFSIENGGLYPATFANFGKNLDLLNKRLYAIHKELTYWDLYKITTSVNSSSEFEAVVAALAPGEACIINTNTFTTTAGVTYRTEDTSKNTLTLSRGDVIVKTINDELIYVPSINSGIYYPAKLETSTSGYTLIFNYSSAMPESNSQASVAVNAQELKEPAASISITGLSQSYSEHIYGLYDEVPINGEFNFTCAYLDAETNPTSPTQLIFPVIKFFLNNEEIAVEYTVTKVSSNWNVKLNNYSSTVFTSGTLFYQVK